MSENRIIILAPRLDNHDALGNDVRGMYYSLQSKGYHVTLVSEGWTINEKVEHLRILKSLNVSNKDLLIYHHAIAWDVGLNIYKKFPGKKIFRYHNVTPASYFKPYHSGIMNSCEMGRHQISEFLSIPETITLSASIYSSNELIKMADHLEHYVLSPFHMTDVMENTEADIETIARFGMTLPMSIPMFLMVGRLAPNKGYLKLLRAFGLYINKLNGTGKLVLAGSKIPGLEKYYLEMKRIIKEYELEDRVIEMGSVSLEELKALYISCSAFITVSDHEGFCVPVVEAMQQGAPVIVNERSALNETGSEAVWRIKDDSPENIACTLKEMEENSELRTIISNDCVRTYNALYSDTILSEKLYNIISGI